MQEKAQTTKRTDHLTSWLVMVANYWGRGATREEAFKKMRAAGGPKKPKQYKVFRVDDKAFVDGYGYLNYTYQGEDYESYLEVESVGFKQES